MIGAPCLIEKVSMSSIDICSTKIEKIFFGTLAIFWDKKLKGVLKKNNVLKIRTRLYSFFE